jgi:membrane dipeptidase
MFLARALGAGGAYLLGACRSRAPAASASGAAAEDATALPLGIDMHNHVYPAGTEPHPTPPGGAQVPPGGAPSGGPPRDEPPGPPRGIADELAASGLTAVCASFVLDFAPMDKPGDSRATLIHWLDAVDAQLAAGKMTRALSLADLQAAHASGRPTIVQSVEGSMFIEGDISRVAEVYGRGMRHLQLLHERDDGVAPLGDVNTQPPHLGGLTPTGQAVVRECDRLGIVVDLAHASHDTLVGASKVATRPFIVSHTSLDSFGAGTPMGERMKPRLISKEQGKIVADAGGVVGVWTHMADSLTAYVASIRAMVEAVGVDHVGIGSDTDLLSSRVGGGTNRAWASLEGGFFHAVVGEMRRQGFSAEDIAKVGGGNFCRVFDTVTKGRF